MAAEAELSLESSPLRWAEAAASVSDATGESSELCQMMVQFHGGDVAAALRWWLNVPDGVPLPAGDPPSRPQTAPPPPCPGCEGFERVPRPHTQNGAAPVSHLAGEGDLPSPPPVVDPQDMSSLPTSEEAPSPPAPAPTAPSPAAAAAAAAVDGAEDEEERQLLLACASAEATHDRNLQAVRRYESATSGAQSRQAGYWKRLARVEQSERSGRSEVVSAAAAAWAAAPWAGWQQDDVDFARLAAISATQEVRWLEQSETRGRRELVDWALRDFRTLDGQRWASHRCACAMQVQRVARSTIAAQLVRRRRSERDARLAPVAQAFCKAKTASQTLARRRLEHALQYRDEIELCMRAFRTDVRLLGHTEAIQRGEMDGNEQAARAALAHASWLSSSERWDAERRRTSWQSETKRRVSAAYAALGLA
eukprot:TRINITY_DN10510_c0_g1_i1.p1 TRINITY_DN10510_c0_g1~~TRINITY_DN10510_c0_g1_i1.p1  ORF type:complete len:423 (+),score=100.62 TRINITY_DN10510_c0_g1_i1:85-1353(+)